MYYYRVKAKNQIGLQSINYSNEASALMPTGLPNTLTITNTTVTGGKTYVWDTLAVGKNPFIDNTCIFSQIPARYEGYRYLKTAFADKTTNTNFVIGFTVSEPVTVYIAWDDRDWTPGFTPLHKMTALDNKWMASYIFQGANVFIDCNGSHDSYSLWAKDFSAGTVQLGCGRGVATMYSVIVTPQGAVSLDQPQVDAQTTLAVSPNPFNEVTTISFAASNRQRIALAIYNCSGKLVKTLVNGEMAPGNYRIPWMGTGLNSGIYIARLKTGSGIHTQKLLLIK
jgi:hypothetical protein